MTAELLVKFIAYFDSLGKTVSDWTGGIVPPELGALIVIASGMAVTILIVVFFFYVIVRLLRPKEVATIKHVRWTALGEAKGDFYLITLRIVNISESDTTVIENFELGRHRRIDRSGLKRLKKRFGMFFNYQALRDEPPLDRLEPGDTLDLVEMEIGHKKAERIVAALKTFAIRVDFHIAHHGHDLHAAYGQLGGLLSKENMPGLYQWMRDEEDRPEASDDAPDTDGRPSPEEEPGPGPGSDPFPGDD